MIRPLPNFEDVAVLSKLGKEYALKNARLDALQQLRDAVTSLNSANSEIEAEGLMAAEQAVKRLREIEALRN